MKFYLMTDLEGVAGVYQWESRDDTSLENHERRMRQRRWLAEEVNAAIAGLTAGGADDIIVNDGHGAGYTIDLDMAAPCARYIHGRERPFWLPYLDETCGATGIVGAHAKACTPGACLCHTMSSAIRDWSFNGVSVGEMGLQAFIAGHFGVPFVFCTGDRFACREIEELVPGCVTVAVKCGLSRFSSVTWPPAHACDLIRRGAEKAMQQAGRIAPLKLDSPVLFREVRRQPSFDPENPPPHSRVIDCRTREIEGKDIIDVMHKIYTRFPLDWQAPVWPD
ncbi:MAG: M55 family metallopeptidase [Kiritimatiellaeota bacterium]|nr:M55 family metallopeptidase [Kiritimatiellota bacterium]